MSRPATNRLKVNPPLGRMPTLQFCRPSELRIDPAYQRNVDSGPSQALIRKIAQFWNWDLCQPLVVARRTDFIDRLFVIDGQHRLEAARLRGDIEQLPCVIVNFENVADEAASFVHLNQQRRQLTKIDIFKAALASGDTEATAIAAAMTNARLSLAPHSNHTAWKPGMVANLAGIQRVWRINGPAVAQMAMQALAKGFADQVLQYAGTIFPGIATVCADEAGRPGGFGEQRFAVFCSMLGGRSQKEWQASVLRTKAEQINLNCWATSAEAFRQAWAEWLQRGPAPCAPPPPPRVAPATFKPAPAPADGKRWCDQCEMRVHLSAASLCKSRHCKLRPALAVSR